MHDFFSCSYTRTIKLIISLPIAACSVLYIFPLTVNELFLHEPGMLMHVWKYCWALVFIGLLAPGAQAQQYTVPMVVTAYCDCGECNGYKRGSWKFLKLDVWNRYVSEGGAKGDRYTAKTASGGRLAEPRAGLISGETIRKPWTVPGKVLLPWRAGQRLGTIAADTSHYPFGTRMYIPGWGWGVVGDRGGAIKGAQRIDIFFNRHGETENWGRPTLDVVVENSASG